MTYTIDYYRGKVERETNFLRYATFVGMFPQLLSGPIERARNMLPQLRQTPVISRHDVADGLSLFVVGLFKKVALADFLALYVNRVYDSPGQYEASALLLASFAYAWQIYFDFSGYTDMARGVARMLGIRLMLNFNNPYLADGLGDFWASLAHQLVHLVQGLRLHSLGRQPPRRTGDLPQHVSDDGHLGPLAWRHVDLCHLGRSARAGPGGYAGIGGLDVLSESGAAASETTHDVLLRHVCLDLLSGGQFRRCTADRVENRGVRLDRPGLPRAAADARVGRVALPVSP